MKVIVRLISVLFLVVMLSACESKPLAEGKSLSEANMIAASLGERGVAATVKKDSGGRGRYSVRVSEGAFNEGVSILKKMNLLSEPRNSFAEIIEPHGILPNSREMEALRLDYARAIELEEVLAALPMAVSAKVVVRSSFPAENPVPAVSVVMQERVQGGINKDDVARVVANALPGIARERIEVVTTTEAPETDTTFSVQGAEQKAGDVVMVPLVPFLFAYRVPAGDYTGMALTFFACIIAVGIVGVFSGYWYRSAQQRERRERKRAVTREISSREDRPMTQLPEE